MARSERDARYAGGMTAYDRGMALIVVDVQNDFAAPVGSLSVRGGDAIILYLNGEIAEAKAAGALVVYTQDWHPATTPHFAKDGGVWPVHCVAGTEGARLHPALQVSPDAPIVRKGVDGEDGYSGFSVRDPRTGETHRTALQELLDDRGIERLVVAGLATDYCVRATVLDGLALGYSVTVLEDGVRAVDLEPGDGEAALAEMRAAGAHLA